VKFGARRSPESGHKKSRAAKGPAGSLFSHLCEFGQYSLFDDHCQEQNANIGILSPAPAHAPLASGRNPGGSELEGAGPEQVIALSASRPAAAVEILRPESAIGRNRSFFVPHGLP